MTDILAEVSCSSSFNMQSVLVSRESLWRLCGYGLSSTDRYLGKAYDFPEKTNHE